MSPRFRPQLPPAKGAEQAIEAYNAAIADLRRQIETIAHARQDAFDQRSERWQYSNAGIDAPTAIEAWDELAEALEDVDLELPDLELPDATRLIPMPTSGAIEAEAVLEPGRGKTKTWRFWC